MTAIFYSDLEVRSANEALTFEARSPHNGTINHKDGRSPSDSEYGFKYRCHQSDFRYRLIDNSAKQQRVLWERWQPQGEDSPHQLLVSDEAWCVIRTHGFRPEIITVSPEGNDTACVKLVKDSSEVYRDTPVRCFWNLEHVSFSTAGLYWSGASWPYFFSYQGKPFFAWRTSWGQRLLVDLERGVLVSDEVQSSPSVAEQLVECEKRGVGKLLADLAKIWNKVLEHLKVTRKDIDPTDPISDKLRRATAALHLVGKLRLPGCSRFLRQWEGVDLPAVFRGTVPKPKWWLECQVFRPIVHHTLRLLNEEPKGFATYYFRTSEGAPNSDSGSICDVPRFQIPERICDREMRRKKLNPHMSVHEVLQLLGSPDHIRWRSRKVGKYYKWYEGWEYDFRDSKGWTTLRIAWKENAGLGEIIGVNEKPSTWMNSDKREAEILREFF